MIAADGARRQAAAVAMAGAAMLLAACQPADHAANDSAAAINAAMPAAVPSPAAPTVDLARYVGHYPFDKVDGTTFLDQPAVKAAVDRLVPDAPVRAAILSGDGVGTPIVRHHGKLRAWSCRQHDCGDHNWTIELAADGADPAICYHDAGSMQGRSRWYTAPGQAELRDGSCPSD